MIKTRNHDGASLTTSPEAHVEHITLNGNGRSTNALFNGEDARIGVVTQESDVPNYEVSSPKVLLITGGTVAVNGCLHQPGEIFTMPIGIVHLQTGSEKLEYISRKASPEILQDTENRLLELEKLGIGAADWWNLSRNEQLARLKIVIGHTDMEKVTLPSGQQILVKKESDNPSGSHYDRVYLKTIEHLETIGFLQPGDELRDITSGSAGTSLALLSYLLGYSARITVPAELPANRIYPMLRFGAKVIDSGAGYVPHASELQVTEIMALRADNQWTEARPADRSSRAFSFSNHEQRICYLNHSENDLSPQAFETIADEIGEQAPDTTHLLLAEGNWTTIAGISPRIRQLLPRVQVIGYQGEVTNNTTDNFGTNVPNVPLRFKNVDLVDAECIVTNIERDAASKAAPQLGRSSLMGLALAQRIIRDHPAAHVVTIAYDQAERY